MRELSCEEVKKILEKVKIQFSKKPDNMQKVIKTTMIKEGGSTTSFSVSLIEEPNLIFIITAEYLDVYDVTDYNLLVKFNNRCENSYLEVARVREEEPRTDDMPEYNDMFRLLLEWFCVLKSLPIFDSKAGEKSLDRILNDKNT